MKKSIFRLAVPVSLCVSVAADSEEGAKETLRKMLSGSTLELGISVADEDVGGDPGGRISPDARIYANDPFDGITVEDVEDPPCPQCGGTGEYCSEAQARTPDPIMHKCDMCNGGAK